jgi:two-component system chemotaxis response regulator CheY
MKEAQQIMRALVIDDSRAMRAILGKILKELGFEVAEAGHGREGLERLRQCGRLRLALVDWNMPEMNGLEFVQAVRADHAYDEVRLMMVTTESEAGAVITALEAGANEYVMKPFTKDVILEKLAIMGIEP